MSAEVAGEIGALLAEQLPVIDPAHHVEMFQEDTPGLWGWQCFTCGLTEFGFGGLLAAERGADEHIASVA